MSMIAPTPRERPEPGKRGRLSKKQQAELFLEHGGRCEECKQKIHGGFEVDHRIALCLGGRHVWANLRPLHPACHKLKTKLDEQADGKCDRIIAREDGTRRERQAIPRRADKPTMTRGFDGKIKPRRSKLCLGGAEQRDCETNKKAKS